jgi:uncharacterized OB-fold protein
MAEPYQPPKPAQEYLKHLAEGRLMLQRARGSGKVFFYPRVMEPGTGARDLEWIEAKGTGTVYSTTVARMRPPTPSYNVAVIELDEGPRLMSRVEGVAPEAVRIGMRVRARITTDGPQPVLLFDPA